MPRIMQNAETYAVTDFQREIRICQGKHDLMTIRSLAEAMGMPVSTLHAKYRNPRGLTAADFRKLVNVLHPDPGATLALLGYTAKEIKKFREDNHE